MLRIREYNKITGKKIELEELEKFGMKYNGSSECYIDNDNYSVLTIYEKSREIYVDLLITGFSDLRKEYERINNRALGILYDLITAGYVEKVEEE